MISDVVKKTLQKVGVDPDIKSQRPQLGLGKFLDDNKIDSQDILSNSLELNHTEKPNKVKDDLSEIELPKKVQHEQKSLEAHLNQSNKVDTNDLLRQF